MTWPDIEEVLFEFEFEFGWSSPERKDLDESQMLDVITKNMPTLARKKLLRVLARTQSPYA